MSKKTDHPPIEYTSITKKFHLPPVESGPLTSASFRRKDEEQPVKVDLQKVMEGTIEMFRRKDEQEKAAARARTQPVDPHLQTLKGAADAMVAHSKEQEQRRQEAFAHLSEKERRDRDAALRVANHTAKTLADHFAKSSRENYVARLQKMPEAERVAEITRLIKDVWGLK
jgi:hypothetical protein